MVADGSMIGPTSRREANAPPRLSASCGGPGLDQALAMQRRDGVGHPLRRVTAAARQRPQRAPRLVAEDPHHRAAHLARRSLEPALPPGSRPRDRRRGLLPEAARAGDGACGAAGNRPADLATQVHDRLVPTTRVVAVEPGGRGSLHRRATGRSAQQRPRATRRTLTSTAATGAPKPSDATAAAVYGPTPGSVTSTAGSPGTRPSWSRTIARAARCRFSALRL